ncbi:phosphoribosylanthranilate isomerase [Candidatus Roizmanbacteria bacterium]|nr:phosphoribosylanthranilate isomerase [Candidatus Roizmanbacteria bacterium]
MQVKVKICGIRSVEAARAAVNAGADFLGFNFVPSSRRYIHPAIASGIINLVSDTVKIVGVFQDAKVNEVNKIASDLKLDYIQLHGNENNEYINKVGIPTIKFITLDDQPEKIRSDYFLLDRPKRGKGKMVDLEKASQLAADFPLFYAGGLTPDNVLIVVKQVKPFAVDVAGGIETNGIQDIKKIIKFISNAKKISIN